MAAARGRVQRARLAERVASREQVEPNRAQSRTRQAAFDAPRSGRTNSGTNTIGTNGTNGFSNGTPGIGGLTMPFLGTFRQSSATQPGAGAGVAGIAPRSCRTPPAPFLPNAASSWVDSTGARAFLRPAFARAARTIA